MSNVVPCSARPGAKRGEIGDKSLCAPLILLATAGCSYDACGMIYKRPWDPIRIGDRRAGGRTISPIMSFVSGPAASRRFRNICTARVLPQLCRMWKRRKTEASWTLCGRKKSCGTKSMEALGSSLRQNWKMVLVSAMMNWT